MGRFYYKGENILTITSGIYEFEMPPNENNLNPGIWITMVDGTKALIPSACTMPPLTTQ